MQLQPATDFESSPILHCCRLDMQTRFSAKRNKTSVLLATAACQSKDWFFSACFLMLGQRTYNIFCAGAWFAAKLPMFLAWILLQFCSAFL